MIKTLNYLIVTCFGIGSIRFAPGTITSLITTVFLYSLFHIINLPNNTILVSLVIIFIYSFYAVSEYIKFNENKDPKEVVIDEFIGQSIPIYLYEISHGTAKDPQDAVLFYLYIFILFYSYWVYTWQIHHQRKKALGNPSHADVIIKCNEQVIAQPSKLSKRLLMLVTRV